MKQMVLTVPSLLSENPTVTVRHNPLTSGPVRAVTTLQTATIMSSRVRLKWVSYMHDAYGAFSVSYES